MVVLLACRTVVVVLLACRTVVVVLLACRTVVVVLIAAARVLQVLRPVYLVPRDTQEVGAAQILLQADNPLQPDFILWEFHWHHGKRPVQGQLFQPYKIPQP